MLTALYVMIGLALLLGVVLGYSALKFKVEGDPLIARIDKATGRPKKMAFGPWMLLGYREQSSFCHAYRQWTGRAPSETRRTH